MKPAEQCHDEWQCIQGRCPLAENCSAPVCLVDPKWRHRKHRRDEPVCYYAREWVKPESGFATGGKLKGGMEGPLRVTMAELVPELRELFPSIDKELTRAARRPSRRGLAKRQGAGHG